jgi:predicted amidophosphoribosyltransferase
MSENYYAARQAESYSLLYLKCPWCAAASKHEDTCSECGEPMDGHAYIACPYCGNEVSEEYAHSNSCCGEMHWERKEPGYDPTTI